MAQTAMITRAINLQERVNYFFACLRCLSPIVAVEISTEENIVAGAQGVRFHTIPFGKIKISRKLLDLLTDPEIDFVLAHEVAHIYLNHLLGTGSFVVARALAEDAAKSGPEMKALLIGWDIVKLLMFKDGKLSPMAALTKEQELAADAWAVFLTGNNVVAARNALLKLCGNNLEAPSHTWEVFDVPLPVMSIRERLTALDARWPSYGVAADH